MSLKLGQKVRYKNALHRAFDGRKRLWKPRDDMSYIKGWTAPKTMLGEGIIVGQRTIYNGTTSYDYDAGNLFTRQEGFRVYVIAYDLRRKHVLVRPEDIEVLDGAE